MTDDEAVVLMVDSNLQRENILPSERAFAYKMKLEAMKRQGERTDLQEEGTSRQIVGKLEAADVLGISLVSLARRLRDRSIPYVKLGNRTLIPSAYLDELVEKALSGQGAK
jgi:excisionase family DNA binding protein